MKIQSLHITTTQGEEISLNDVDNMFFGQPFQNGFIEENMKLCIESHIGRITFKLETIEQLSFVVDGEEFALRVSSYTTKKKKEEAEEK